MYEKLVGDLRYCAKGDCNGCRRYTKDTRFCNALLRDAADAVEELSREYESVAASLTESVELVRKLQSPRWVSVTERLPEKYTDVLIYYERNAWPDGADYPVRKREIGVGFCGGPDRWHVDHCSGVDGLAWMPLPQLPKEEA